MLAAAVVVSVGAVAAVITGHVFGTTGSDALGRSPISLPAGTPQAVQPSLAKRHLFVIVMENRSFSDVYATAGFAMGEGGLGFIDRVPGYEAYAIDRNLIASWTSGFDRHCAPAT